MNEITKSKTVLESAQIRPVSSGFQNNLYFNH